MISQLDFLSNAEPPRQESKKQHATSEEETAFSALLQLSKEWREENNIPDNILCLNPLVQNCSVCLIDEDHPFCYIRIRKQSRYILFQEEAAKSLPSGIATKTIASDNGLVRALLNTPGDVLLCVDAFISALQICADKIYTFDCCSRYEECSDARRCISTRPTEAIGCTYKRRLLAGQIYYGKNPTV